MNSSVDNNLLSISGQSIPEPSLAASVISFGRVLKQAGFAVSIPSVMDALQGVSRVGPEDLHTFKTVLKATFMTRIEESAAFERLFYEFWIGALAQAFEQEGFRKPAPADETPESDEERSPDDALLPPEANT